MSAKTGIACGRNGKKLGPDSDPVAEKSIDVTGEITQIEFSTLK